MHCNLKYCMKITIVKILSEFEDHNVWNPGMINDITDVNWNTE